MDNRAKVILAVTIPLIIFFALTFYTFGPTFLVLVTHSDDYRVGIGVGTSMYPTIKSGDIIIYDTTPNKIGIGDIIVYYHPKIGLIGHRVIMVTDDGFVVRGDNNQYSDPWLVDKNEIVGKVVLIIDGDVQKAIATFWLKLLGYWPETN